MITAAMVKELREITSAGMLDCQKALKETDGNMEKAIEFLKEKAVNAKKGILKPEDYYDLIILDPPTFSNSKNTFNVLDINRDWPQLVKDCLNILAPGGILYFSTNSTKLIFDTKLIPQFTASNKAIMITDITEESIPKDFEGTKCHKAWEFKIAK